MGNRIGDGSWKEWFWSTNVLTVWVTVFSIISSGGLFLLFGGYPERIYLVVLICLFVSSPLTYFVSTYVNKLNQEVQDEVDRLKAENIQVTEARKNMELVTEARSRFLSNMSHEIRNVLTSVIGMTNFLLEENPRSDQLENITVLKFSADNLMVLVNDILDFGKIEQNQVQFEETDFQVRKIVRLVKEGLRVKCLENKVELKICIDSKVPEFIVGDPTRLSQVLSNLLSNAVKFTRNGEVRLHINWISENAEVVQLGFEVIDTGVGIADHMLEHIFEVYTQAKANTTRHFGGSGLGLPISKRILELLGSHLKVESEEGVGSKFFYELEFIKSLVRPSDKGIHKEYKLTNADLDGMRILLVEDNKLNQLVASKFLKKWKAEYDLAENGAIALEMVKANLYDVVLMDLNMPVMNGIEATRTIREQEGQYFKDLPIIALTASAMLEERGKVMSAGMNDYISKPFDPTELYQAIHKQVFLRQVS